MSETNVLENNPVKQAFYTPEMMLLILQNYGLSVGPRALLSTDETNERDIYIYPMAHVFPINSFLEDTISYFLARGEAAKARRIGFFIQNTDGKLFLLSLDLSDWRADKANEIRQELIDKNYKDTKAILEDKPLAEKFRHLYGKAEVIILGLAPDAELVEKLKPLILRAYALEMQLNFVPVENEQYRDVHLVQDILSVLRTGKIARGIPAMDICHQHRDLCKQALRVYEDQYHAHQKVMRGLEAYLNYVESRGENVEIVDHDKNKQLN